MAHPVLTEAAAPEAFYLAHVEAVRGWARGFALSDGAAVDDLTQDVFVRWYESPRAFSSEGEARAWLYRVLANAAVSRFRKQALVRRLGAFFTAGGATQTSDAAAGVGAELQSLARCIERLPARERVVVSCLVWERLSQAEVAERLGWSRGYVSQLVTRAQAALRAEGWEVDGA